MCFNPSPERRVPSPNRYMAFARFCFCKNNKRTIIINQHAREPARVRSCTRDLRRHMKESVPGHSSPSSVGMHSSILRISNQLLGCRTALRELREVKELERLSVAQLCIELLGNHNLLN